MSIYFKQGCADALLSMGFSKEAANTTADSLEEQPSVLGRSAGAGVAGALAGGGVGLVSAAKRLTKSPTQIRRPHLLHHPHQVVRIPGFDQAVRQGTVGGLNPRFRKAIARMSNRRVGKGALIGGGIAAALGAGSAYLARKNQPQQ